MVVLKHEISFFFQHEKMPATVQVAKRSRRSKSKTVSKGKKGGKKSRRSGRRSANKGRK